jgi:serine/threonine protein kinase
MERVVRLLRQVADSLDYAHAQGVVHRDIKPSNIIVGPDDHVTLIDFGIAQALNQSRLERVGVVVGTFEYMAPELVTQGGGSPGADLYALGIVAYQMLAGRVPFTGKSAHSIMYRHINESPVPPSDFRPELPKYVDEAILRQLSKSSHDRFSTGLAFIDTVSALKAPSSQTTAGASDGAGLTKTDSLASEEGQREVLSDVDTQPYVLPTASPGDVRSAEPDRSLRVFLCHSSSDKPVVRSLYHQLSTEPGIQPWLDEEDILPGQDWDREIQRAVRNSDAVIVCLSRVSVTKAGYLQKEIRFALDVADEKPEGMIFLIPARLEECEVPDRLSRRQWVDCYEDRGYERLLRALRQRAAEVAGEARIEPLR